MIDQLRDRTEVLGVVAEVRGKGLMVGVELVEPGTLTPNPAAATFVLEECRRGGVLIGKGGLYNNVLRIAPPMSVTMDEAAHAVQVLGDAIAAADRASHSDRVGSPS
jgi:4-aminobutyrate aminotransferase